MTRIKIGYIGCGFMAQKVHIPNFASIPECEIVGLAEIRTELGYTVTSPLLPELVTEGDSLDESLENVKDAFKAVLELYQELGRSLPENIQISDKKSLVWLETVVTAS